MFSLVEAGKKTHHVKAKITKSAPMVFMDVKEENKKETIKERETEKKKKESKKEAEAMATKKETKNEPFVYVSTPKKVENKSRTNGEWPQKRQPKASISEAQSPAVVSSFQLPASPHIFIWTFLISLVGLVLSFMKDDLSEHFRRMKSTVYKKAFLKDLRPKNFHPVVSDEISPTQEPDRNTLSELLPSLPSVPQIDLSSMGLPSMTSNKAATVPQKLQTYAVPPETSDQSVSGKEAAPVTPVTSNKSSTNTTHVTEGNHVKIETQKSENPSHSSSFPIESVSRKMGVFFSSPFSVKANSKSKGEGINVTDTQKSDQSNSAVAVKPNESPSAVVTATAAATRTSGSIDGVLVADTAVMSLSPSRKPHDTSNSQTQSPSQSAVDFLYAIGSGMQTTANVMASAATVGVPTSPSSKSSNSNMKTSTTDNASTNTSVHRFIEPVVFSYEKDAPKTMSSQSSNRIPFSTPTTTANGNNNGSNGSNQRSTSSSGSSTNRNITGDRNGNAYTPPDLRDLVSEGSDPGTPMSKRDAGGAGADNGQGQGGYGRGRRYFDIRNYQDASGNDRSAAGDVDDDVAGTADKPNGDKDEPTILNLWHVLY